MAPAARVRRSEFSSRVTLYEPAAGASPPPPLARARSTRSATAAALASSSPVAIKGEYESEEDDDVKPARARKPKASPSPRKPKPFVNALDKAHPEPKKWREQYAVIENQRKGIVAPVDNMGCEQGGRELDEAPPSDKDRRLSTLVSLMLSSQTKDPVTHQATMNLRNQLPGGLTVDALLAASFEQINAAICKVGFHNIKTNNLMKLAIRLRDEHNGEVPLDLPSLLAINGVGPKMALLLLQSEGLNVGIGVDTHVHRITNRLGWHKPATQQAEQTRLNLQSWLPQERWKSVNHMLVGFGQVICKPVGPRCDLCDVAKVPYLCPSKRTVVPPKSSPVKPEPKTEIDVELPRTPPKLEIGIEAETVVKMEVDEAPLADVVVAPVEGQVLAVKSESPEKPLVW